MKTKLIIGASVVLTLFVLAGCDNALSKKTVNIDCAADKVGVNVATNMDSKNYCVEIADDFTKRGKGLMYRESMPEDEGMLFIFDESEKVSFWMKNTYISLDLLMFDEDMNMLEIKDNFQPFENPPCDSYHSENEVKYVLEVNENQYDEGIKDKEVVLFVEKY